jgi:hypothetical protein
MMMQHLKLEIIYLRQKIKISKKTPELLQKFLEKSTKKMSVVYWKKTWNIVIIPLFILKLQNYLKN